MTEGAEVAKEQSGPAPRVHGIAPIKPEYLVSSTGDKNVVDYKDEDEGKPMEDPSSGGRTKKEKGMNKKRKFHNEVTAIKVCDYAVQGTECTRGAACKFTHNIKEYLDSKPSDIEGICPVFRDTGYCSTGIKCRWLHSHYKDGQLLVNEELKEKNVKDNYEFNKVSYETKQSLRRKNVTFDLSEKYIPYVDGLFANPEDRKENAAVYTEPPLLPIEKKKIDYKGKMMLSPLTTVGNLPYRRLMKTLGADITYSEMGLALPFIQGANSEWALVKGHSSELGGFGVQIAAPKPWQAIKAAEAIGRYAPDASEINLNCGCPIDLLYRQGAGSALMDNPARILKMMDGMNAVSGDLPVTLKIRTGTRDGHPTAKNLVTRVLDQGSTAAIIIHGRSRAQRYTKMADWNYIGEVASLVKDKREKLGEENSRYVKPWIVGNGDVYSWKDWYDDIETSGADSVLVARGALIKPWIFKEIEAKQYLDISATERLDIYKDFASFGLQHWGSDEYGVNTTRRFMCELLSFTHRYIPVGILEHLPPKINDRPPPWKGRNELETLLGSTDYKDWIKITEMFLGPSTPAFEFVPKHKSNAYNDNTREQVS